MKIENTGSMIEAMAKMNTTGEIHRQHARSEAQDKVFISPMEKIKEATKTYKPPYFPIGDTQAIFKK